MFHMRNHTMNMKKLDKESKSQEKDMLQIIMPSNIRLNTYLKYSKRNSQSMSQLIDIKRELNIIQLRDKLFTNPNNK
jgi:hypothetical protein